MDPRLSEYANKPFSGGKARSWVPRACDRCRKRKARCDEAVPCKNCSDAGARCTHDAPVLKRGPRPRQTQQSHDLESRLRNLEHLISSIPGGGSSSTSGSLSTNEITQIHNAAQPTPGSDTASPHEAWIEAAGPSSTTQYIGSSSYSNGQTTNLGSGSNWSGGGGGASEFGLMQAQTPQMQMSGMVPTYGSSSSGYGASMQGGSSIQDRLGQLSRSPTSGAGQDLLYKDAQGQTKFLGPSSGMPLLDKLKIGVSPPPQSGMSLAEEWISLSAAIGVEVGQPLPQAGSSTNASFAKSPATTVEDDTLCEKFTSFVPPDLMDQLIRAYFTISHLLWPILHAPTFMQQYSSPTSHRNASFVALVMAVCSLSSRYVQDPRMTTPDHEGRTIACMLINFARDTISKLACERTDLEIVQALFCMSVVQEGTARPNLLWVYLSQALSMAIDLGLHKRVDDYSTFSAVDVEVRKRTMWALYAQDVKASCTFGRPPMLRLTDLDLDEPAAVDDVYISAETGIGVQPPDRPSLMAGFVAALRLHMVLERTIRRINKPPEESDTQSFRSLLLPKPRVYSIPDELELLSRVTEGIPGEWNYTPSTVADPDSVRFFQKTRVWTLQHFIRLLGARHRFSELLERLGAETNGSPAEQWNSPGDEGQAILHQITQSALGIIGTYCVIDARGRLGFFGAHALTQAGAGLIGVILHLRSLGSGNNDPIWHLAMQGLPAGIQILRQLGKRRPAGLRSAELLAEFSRACRIPVFTGPEPSHNTTGSPSATPPVEVPMLRSLPRRASIVKGGGPGEFVLGDDLEEWLTQALAGSTDTWMTVGDRSQVSGGGFGLR